MAISKAAAILRYFNAPSPISGPVEKCSTREIKEFKESCTPEQWDAYAKAAAAEIGETLEG